MLALCTDPNGFKTGHRVLLSETLRSIALFRFGLKIMYVWGFWVDVTRPTSVSLFA